MQRRYRPAIMPALCVATLFPILAALGFWQLDRAQEKLNTKELYESRITAPALHIGAQMETPEEMEYRKVAASGEWDQSKEFLVDNRVYKTQPGFHVITPLILGDKTSAVLVNRGWVPAPADRAKLVELPRISGSANVSGIAILPPSEHFMLKQAEPIGDTWQPIWQALDLNRFQEAAGYRMHNFVLILEQDHPDSFRYDWSMQLDTWIFRHRAYAMQWFALAATLIVIYFALNWRRFRKRA